MNGANFFLYVSNDQNFTVESIYSFFFFFALIYRYKSLFHYLYRVIDKTIMPQPAKKRRVTHGKLERNL